MVPDPDETLRSLAAEAADGNVSGPALVRRFIRAALREWEERRQAAAPKSNALEEALASASPTAKSLQPLIDLVEGRMPGDADATNLEKVCQHSLARQYMSAEQIYLQLTNCNAAWPIGGAEFVSSDGPRESNRCWGVKTRKVDSTASLLDNNSQRAALQGLKRLVTFMKAIWPDAITSKP